MSHRSAFPEFQPNGTYRNGNGAAPPPPVEMLPEEEMSLQDVLEILDKGKWIILGCFMLVLGVVALYTFMKAPEYESRSTLLVNNQQSSPQLAQLLDLQGGRRNIANEVEILKSRMMAMRVAEELTAQRTLPGSDKPLTVLANGRTDTPLNTLQVANRLRGGYIDVQPLGRDVDLIGVTVTSTDPEEAAYIANLYAATFLEYNQNSSRARMRASREFLSGVTERFQGDLESAENQLRVFLDEERVVAPDAEAQQFIEQITELQGIQYQTQAELGMNQAELVQLREELERMMPNLADQISSGTNVMIDRLNEQIARLEIEAEQKYTKNPRLRENPSADRDLVTILSQIEGLRQRRHEFAEQLVADATASGSTLGGGALNESSAQKLSPLQNLRAKIMEKQIVTAGLQARLDVVHGQLAEMQAQLGDVPRKEIILNGLRRSLETREQLYISLVEKLQEARIAEESELGYVEIIDVAIVPNGPVRPQPLTNMMLGVVVALVLGVGLAFTRNVLDNKVRKPEDLRKRGFNVLGVIPGMERIIRTDFDRRETVEVDGRALSTRLIALLNPLSPIAEAYRRLRTNIQFSRPDGGVQTILVSSAGPGEGKSVTSMNLAVTVAQAGQRTVYIDADLRKPVGHKMMGQSKEPGLVDLLFEPGRVGFEQFMSPVENLYIIPAGRTVPNPTEIVGSQRMRDLLITLKKEFDFIIIDTPPILAVTDALSVVSQVDGVLLVCSAVETTWQAVERSSEAVSAVGARVSGIVLNRFDAKAAYGGYGSGYAYGYEYYESYYGEKHTTHV